MTFPEADSINLPLNAMAGHDDTDYFFTFTNPDTGISLTLSVPLTPINEELRTGVINAMLNDAPSLMAQLMTEIAERYQQDSQ